MLSFVSQRLFLYSLVFTLILSYSPSQAKTRSMARSYSKAASKYHALYKPTKFRKYESNWIATIHAFQKIKAASPKSKYAPLSLFNIANLYNSLYKWNHDIQYLQHSIASYKQFTLLYNKHTLADDALFRLATIYKVQKKSPRLAFETFLRLKQEYPKSEFRNHVTKELATLQKKYTFLSKKSITTPQSMYAKGAKQYRLLLNHSTFTKNTNNWINTIQLFLKIAKQYPKYTKAPDSLFNAAKLYNKLYFKTTKKKYLEKEREVFTTLVKQYPTHSLADDGQYYIAKNYDYYAHNAKQAYLSYAKLLQDYPGTSFASIAKNRLRAFPREAGKDKETRQASASLLALETLLEPHYGGLSYSQSRKANYRAIKNISYWTTKDWSRIVIESEKKLHYKYQLLRTTSTNQHKRLFIDLSPAYLLPKHKKQIEGKSGLLYQTRIAQFSKNTVRIVLDLNQVQAIKVFPIAGESNYKIIMDIVANSTIPSFSTTVSKTKPKVIKKRNSTKKELIKNHQDNAKTAIHISKNSAIPLSKILGLKIKTIIIDPGHGGKDPGAIQKRNRVMVKEKHINLAIALALQKILHKQQPNIKTYLTRQTDIFIPLETRTAIANQKHGDLFISIHANSSVSHHPKGIETYFLSLTNDQKALALVARENASSLKSISDLQNILENVMTNSKVAESRLLAQSIQTSMEEYIVKKNKIKTYNLGVKKAPFIVLIGAHMPSVLTEVGFISNPEERARLLTKKYQALIAKSIYLGIKNYLTSMNTL